MIERLFGETAVAPVSRLWIWRLLFRPVRSLVTLFLGIEVTGREHVPASGPYIIAANHINWRDPPAVSIALGTPIRWMAKIEVFDLPILGFVLRGIGNFSIRRGESDRRAIALAVRVLQAGLPLGVFPEGHRSEKRTLLKGQPGIALLAERTDALIVPCGIVGTPGAMPHVPRHSDIRLRFGPPFRFSDLPAEIRADRRATADAVMRRIAELLPPEMRGVYSEGIDRTST